MAQTAQVIGLGVLQAQQPGSGGWGVSADGLVATGYSEVDGGWLDTSAFIWTQEGGMVAVAPSDSDGRGISADGRVIVGTISPINEAFYWNVKEGVVTLGDLPGNLLQSVANAVSADGSVIVGQASSDRATNFEAFRWTKKDGMVGLGGLDPNKIFSIAFGISADGNMITGLSEDADINGVIK